MKTKANKKKSWDSFKTFAKKSLEQKSCFFTKIRLKIFKAKERKGHAFRKGMQGNHIYQTKRLKAVKAQRSMK